LQLAAALGWVQGQPSGQPFVCLDHRLRAAAQREGFLLMPSSESLQAPTISQLFYRQSALAAPITRVVHRSSGTRPFLLRDLSVAWLVVLVIAFCCHDHSFLLYTTIIMYNALRRARVCTMQV